MRKRKIIGVIGEVAGVSPIARMVSHATATHRVVGKAARYTVAAIVKAIFGDGKDAAPGLTDPAERFTYVQSRKGLTAANLKAKENSYFVTLCVATAIACISPVVGLVQSGPRSPLAIVFVPLLFALIAIKAAYYREQIRARQLIPLKAWLVAKAKRMRAVSLISIFFAALLAVPGLAHADTIHADFTNRGDIPGTVLGTLTVDGGNPFTWALSSVSWVALYLSMCLFAYSIIHMLIDAAHTGNALEGKSGGWQMWYAILRLLVGVAMLEPWGGSGLCIGQRTLLEFEVVCNNFASDVLKQFVSNTLVAQTKTNSDGTTTTDGGTGLGIRGPMSGIDIAHELLQSELCIETYKHEPTTENWVGSTYTQPYFPIVPPVGGVRSGDGNRQVWDYGECGELSVPLTVKMPSQVAATSDSNATAFVEARVAAIGAIVASLRTGGLAAQMAKSNQGGYDTYTPWPTGVVATVGAIGATYDSTMEQASGTFLSSENATNNEELLSAVSTNGWPVMGALSRALGQSSVLVAGLAAQKPDYSGFSGRRDWPMTKEVLANENMLSDDWIAETKTPALFGVALAEPGDENGDFGTSILNSAMNPIGQAAIAWGATNSIDPIESEQRLGENMLTAAEVGVTAGTVVAVGAGNFFTKNAGAETAFNWLSPLARSLIVIAALIGISHAIVLPMMPFLISTYLFVDWIMFTGEALIAMPFAFAMWARADGSAEGIVSAAQKAGLVIIFNLLLLPVISVLGFIFCSYALPLAMQPVNKMFAASFVGAQGGSIIGIVVILSGLVLQCYVQYQVTLRVYSAISRIPNNLSSWFGASAAPTTTAGDAAASTHNTAIAAGNTTVQQGAAAAERASGKGAGPKPTEPPTSKIIRERD